MDLGGYSATGPRDANEDNHYERSFTGSGVFLNGVDTFIMVSDGMGGYQGGDIASGLAVSSADHYLSNLLQIANGNTIEFDPRLALSEIAGNAHEAITSETHARGNASMGATFVGAFLSPGHAWIGHVGDSRAYLVRGGDTIQLTEDHSRVGRMLSRGVITEEEAQNHPERNKIERALGFENSEMEFTETDLQPGDALMLCSDGAYTVLDKQTIGSLFARGGSANEVARRIVEAALFAETDDNTTVSIAVRDEKGAEAPKRRKSQPTIRKAPAHGAGNWSEIMGADETQELRGSQDPQVTTRIGETRQPPKTQRIDPSMRRAVAKHPSPAREDAPQPKPVRRNSRSASPRRPTFAVIIPIALFALLALGVGGLFMFSQRGVSREPVAAGSEPGVATGNSAGQTSGAGSNHGTSGASNDSADQSSSESYTVTEDAYLRFVDANGVAQLFTVEDAGFEASPYVLANTRVVASAEESNYGRYEPYRALDSRYVSDLKNDCELYRQGTTMFTSGLAQMTDQEGYKTLVRALSEQESSSRGIGIETLLLKSADLSPAESAE